MKKSVLFSILLIYILSIVIVGIFGVKYTSYNPTIYVNKIEINGENIKNMGYAKYQTSFKFNEKDKNNNFVIFSWQVLPKNSTNKKVIFEYDRSSTIAEFINDGIRPPMVKFKKFGTFTIKINPADRPGEYGAELTIIAKK